MNKKVKSEKNLNLKKNQEVSLTIEDFTKEGEGLGKYQGFPLFVKDTVIGDEVKVSITKLKKNYGYARLVEIIKPSEDRVTPLFKEFFTFSVNNFTVPRNPYISRRITIFSHNYTIVIQKLSTKLSTYVDNFCITCEKPLNIVLIKFFLFIKNHIYQRFKMLIKLYTLFFHCFYSFFDVECNGETLIFLELSTLF